jgi:3-oxoacyl-[acyl-carrier protein] reductase
VNETPEQPRRTVLVTGSSQGIGWAVAETMQQAGYQVAGLSRSGRAPSGVLPLIGDVTNADDINAAVAEVEKTYGPVEILINNAGITRDTLLMRMSDDDFDQVIATNLTSAFRLTRAVSRKMMRASWGRVVFMSSVVGLLGSPGQVNYAASKAGLIGMARSLSRELGSRNITFNVVAPGFIETDMTAALSESTIEGYRSQIPLGRMGQVDDVAAAVKFLCSEQAGYITGAVIPVDGGLGMGH